MSPDDPRHGTYPGAQLHIRSRVPLCEPCHRSFLRYRRQRRIDIAQGRPRMTPSAPTVQHVKLLRAQGATAQSIAASAGVSYSLIDELLNRPRATIRADNADALLATDAPPIASGQVDSTGTVRRIRALGRVGWSMRAVADAAGLRMETLRSLNTAGQTRVTVATAKAVAEAYERLAMKAPPPGRTSSQVRAKAELKGWAPPLAWDDIDDPNEKPQGLARRREVRSRTEVDPMLVEIILAGEWSRAHNCTRDERREVCRRWVERGGSLKDLEDLTGWNSARYYQSGTPLGMSAGDDEARKIARKREDAA